MTPTREKGHLTLVHPLPEAEWHIPLNLTWTIPVEFIALRFLACMMDEFFLHSPIQEAGLLSYRPGDARFDTVSVEIGKSGEILS